MDVLFADGLTAEEAGAFMLSTGELCPEASDQYYSALSDGFFDVYSDAYYDPGTP
jgi:hypothetical protein